jgi:glycosyltransferase involved in cell wall biosynthesis
MKVLMLSATFAPIIGGAENVVQNLTLKLNENGIKTDLMTFNMNTLWHPIWKKEVIEKDFRITRIPGINLFHKMKYNPLKLLFRVNVIPSIRFLEILKEYDILHFHNDSDLSFPLFSKFVKGPKILHCHTLSGTHKQYRLVPPNRILLNKLVDSYICVSKSDKNLLADLGIKEERIQVLYNGVNPNFFKPNYSEKIEDLLLFVGRLDPSKGIPVLLESLKFLKIPTKLKIIGPLGNQIMNSNKKQLGIHEVEWLGYKTGSQLVEWYQKASIVVCPSLSESLGITNLEALSCGTPIVASNVGGIPEIVQDRFNGLLVSPNNPKDLASAIQELLLNPDLRKEYGINGRIMVENKFSWDYITRSLVKIYEKKLKDT